MAQQPIEGISQDKLQALINKFEQACLAQESASQQNNLPLIVGSVVIIPVVFGLLFLLTSKMVKKFQIISLTSNIIKKKQ
jgi:hypothetical protein